MRGKLKTLRSRDEGFTVIEIVAVLVVIGVLLTLVFAAYSGVHRNERNQERKRNIDAIYKQLERYNVKNAKYPSLAEMNNPSWRATNMSSLSPQTLRDPSGKSDMLASTPTKDAYAYQPTSASGGSCDDIKTNCLHYTLTATLENSTPGTYVKTSLN